MPFLCFKYYILFVGLYQIATRMQTTEFSNWNIHCPTQIISIANIWVNKSNSKINCDIVTGQAIIQVLSRDLSNDVMRLTIACLYIYTWPKTKCIYVLRNNDYLSYLSKHVCLLLKKVLKMSCGLSKFKGLNEKTQCT